MSGPSGCLAVRSRALPARAAPRRCCLASVLLRACTPLRSPSSALSLWCTLPYAADQVIGKSSCGLDVLSPLDGTNKIESSWSAIEKTFSASSYAEDYAHALGMASAERVSVKGNVAAGMHICM